MKTFFKVLKNEYKKLLVFPCLFFLMYFFFGFIPQLVWICNNKSVNLNNEAVMVLSIFSTALMLLISAYLLWFKQDKYKLSNVSEASVLVSKIFILFLSSIFFNFIFQLCYFILKCVECNLTADMAITAINYYDLFILPIGIGCWAVLLYSFCIGLSKLGQSKIHNIIKLIIMLILLYLFYGIYVYLNTTFCQFYTYSLDLENYFPYKELDNNVILYLFYGGNLFFTVNFLYIPSLTLFLLTVTISIFLYFVKSKNYYGNLNCKTQNRAIWTNFTVLVLTVAIILGCLNLTPLSLGEQKTIDVNLQTGESYDISENHNYDNVKYNYKNIMTYEKLKQDEEPWYMDDIDGYRKLGKISFSSSNNLLNVDENLNEISFYRPGEYLICVQVRNIFSGRQLTPIQYVFTVEGEAIDIDDDMGEKENKLEKLF